MTKGRDVLERVLPGRKTPNKSTIAPSQCTHNSHMFLHDLTTKKWRVIKFTYVQMDIFMGRMRRTRGYGSLDKFKFNGSDRSCAVLLDVRMVHPAVFQTNSVTIVLTEMRRSLFVSALGLTTSISLLLATRRAAAFALPAIPLFHSSRGWTSVIPVRDQSATARAYKSSRKGGQYSIRGDQEDRTSTRPRARETEVEPAARIQRDYPHVVLRAGKARLFLEGNPLVYGEAVHEVVGHVADGDFVEVVDHRGNLIGKGCYNSQSMYRVRLLWHAREKGEALYASSLEDIVARRVSTAWTTRQALGLPNAETTCFRLVNGEGDKLSGLAADVFDKVCVVSSSSLWCERHKDFIIQGLEASLGPAGISTVWRRSEARLKQDGFVDPEEALRPAIDVKAEARKEGAYVWAKEAGLKYKVYPELGQKTGFYCDQRQNRQMIQSLSRGKRVLDLFCYTGGFALNGTASARGIGCQKGKGRHEGCIVNGESMAKEILTERHPLDAGLNFVHTLCEPLLSFHSALFLCSGPGGCPRSHRSRQLRPGDRDCDGECAGERPGRPCHVL